MDYKVQIENIKNQFQNSFNFNVLKNNYGYSDAAREYLDEYKNVLNDMWIEDSIKYERLIEIINRNMEVTLLTVRTIPNINKMWEPNYDAVKEDTEYYKADISERSKTVCEAIQQLFENSKIRKSLTNTDLYNLYASYYEISTYIKNKDLTDKILIDIETKLRSISDKIWKESITSPENYKAGESFMFIVHNISKTDMDSLEFENSFSRNGRVSTSLITDKEMGVYGAHKYGFIYPNDSKIVTCGYKDLYSYETKEEGNFYQNSSNSILITPQAIEHYSEELNIEENGRRLNSDNANIYNEILLDTTDGLKPVGIYCITFGENDLNYDYQSAKTIAGKTGLPLIEIDISLYRTKDNQGTYLTDVEPLTISEQKKFAEDFLKQYYKFTSSANLETIQNFIESDLALYQENIVDIFLSAKRSEEGINKENLFRQFTQFKIEKRNKLENFNKNLNESKKLVESIKNFQDALNSTDNMEFQTKIQNEIDTLTKRVDELNKLMINENSLDLSSENWIYQSNKISSDIMQGFTPFVIEKIKIGDKVVDAITGYKTKEQIEQEKEQMLEQVTLSSDPITERLEHAKRVIEVKCNGYITNSTISDINQYESNTPELDRVVENSRAFLDVVHLDKEITDYDDLIAIKQELINGINELESNRKILDGSFSIDGLEQLQRDSAIKIDGLNERIKLSEEQIRELRSGQTQLSFEKQQIEKGFIRKIISSRKIQELEVKIKKINNEIENLERVVELSKNEIKFEESFINGQVENFLSNFGLDGMTLDDYKLKLKVIEPNGYELTDLSKQKDMEARLTEIEKRISEMKINAENEKEKRQQLLSQKQQLGISSNVDIKEIQNIEEEQITEELPSGIRR